MSKQIHVVPHDGQWAFLPAGQNRVSRVFRTQKDAIDAARERARKDCAELITHGVNGRIRASDSHGHDPCPPRDRA